MTDDKPTPEEEIAAEALARALDGEGGPEVPEDALQAAAFLRFSADGGELDGERSAAILDELMADVAAVAKPVPIWKRWRSHVGGLAAAASMLVLFALLQLRSPESPGPTELPGPELALLAAQTRAAQPGADGLAALNAEMRSYRGEVYASLIDHYQEEPDR